MAGLVLTQILEVPMMMEMPVDTGVMASLKYLVQSLPEKYMNVDVDGDVDVDKYVVEYVMVHSVTKVMANIYITVQMARVDTEVVEWSSCPGYQLRGGEKYVG